MNFSGRISNFLYFMVGKDLKTARVKMVCECVWGLEEGGER